MLKLSHYNIYLPAKNQNNDYLLIQGYTGAVDVVSQDIYEILKNGINNPNNLTKLNNDNMELLKRRGYLTERSFEAEKEVMRKVAETIHKVHSKNISITVIPTYGCNFRCSYCFEQNLLKNGSEWMGETMTEDTVDLLFMALRKKEAEGKKIGSITLYGGEPLLYKNYNTIRHIVESATKNNILVNAVTNGYNLDKFVDMMSEDKIGALQITIDGLEDYHDKRRYLAGGTPTFRKITENIEQCLSKGIKIVIRTNIDKSNICQMDDLINFYSEKKWSTYSNFSYYFKSVHACYMEDNERVTDVNIINELRKNHLKADLYKLNTTYSAVSNMAMNLFESKGYAPFHAGFCGSTIGMIVVDPYRDIYPCWEVVGKSEYIIGQLDDNGNINFNDTYQLWRHRTINNIEKCLECKYALFCGGGCPAHAEVSNGTIYSAYCENYIDIFNEVFTNTYIDFIRRKQEAV